MTVLDELAPDVDVDAAWIAFGASVTAGAAGVSSCSSRRQRSWSW